MQNVNNLNQHGDIWVLIVPHLFFVYLKLLKEKLFKNDLNRERVSRCTIEQI